MSPGVVGGPHANVERGGRDEDHIPVPRMRPVAQGAPGFRGPDEEMPGLRDPRDLSRAGRRGPGRARGGLDAEIVEAEVVPTPPLARISSKPAAGALARSAAAPGGGPSGLEPVRRRRSLSTRRPGPRHGTGARGQEALPDVRRDDPRLGGQVPLLRRGLRPQAQEGEAKKRRKSSSGGGSSSTGARDVGIGILCMVAGIGLTIATLAAASGDEQRRGPIRRLLRAGHRRFRPDVPRDLRPGPIRFLSAAPWRSARNALAWHGHLARGLFRHGLEARATWGSAGACRRTLCSVRNPDANVPCPVRPSE